MEEDIVEKVLKTRESDKVTKRKSKKVKFKVRGVKLEIGLYYSTLIENWVVYAFDKHGHRDCLLFEDYNKALEYYNSLIEKYKDN